MADVNIGAKITVDTGGSAKSINELQGDIKKLSGEMKGAKIGTDEYKAAAEKLKQAQDKLTSSTKEKTSSFAQLKDELKSSLPAFDGAASGAVGFGQKLLALAANPIVLIIVGIVAALKFLYEAFTYSVAGGKKMEQMFEGVKAAISVVVDRVMSAGQAITKFFSGDWKGAAASMTEAFNGVGDAILNAYDAVSKATAGLQKLKKEEREASVARAAQNAAIVKSKELLNDETASLQDRKKALQEVGAIERKIGEEDVERAKKKLELQKVVFGQTKEGLKKHAQELADMQIEISNKEEETARHEIQLQRQARTLNKQEKSEAKAADAEAKAAEKERRQNQVEYLNKLLKLQQANELELLRDGYEKEKKVAENKFNDEKRALELSLQDKKITKAQFNILELETEKNFNLTLDALKDKNQKAEQAKTVAFQKELAAINKETTLAGIDDVRIKEKLAIEETYRAKREQVLANEKLTANQREILLNALAAESEANRKALETKFGKEDAAKELAGKKALLKADYDLKVAHKLKTYELELEFFNKTREIDRLEMVAKKASGLELKAFDEETTAGSIRISETEKDVKLKNLAVISGALGGLGDLVGKQTALGKGLAVAQAIIDTYAGASKALAQGGIYGGIAAAGIIASGLANVNKIISTPVPGQSGGSSVSLPSSVTATAPILPENQTTQLNQASINGIGNAASTRAFVIESDVTNNQQRITRLNRAARLG